MKFYSAADKAGEFFWSYVYFHNAAEAIADDNRVRLNLEYEPPDLVRSDSPRDSVEDGVYDGSLYEEPVKVFIWTSGMGKFIRQSGIVARPVRHGLILLASDTDSIAYAQEKFQKKSSIL